METKPTGIWQPKVYDFAEGQLRVELLPAQVSAADVSISHRIRIKAVNLSPDRYRVTETWMEELYPNDAAARCRYHSFSGADAEYWMNNFYLLHMQPLTD
jgi:hypothetical protein